VPQFAASVVVSTQLPLHRNWAPGHGAVQRPATQESPGWQASPQLPQFFVSFCKSEQTVPHRFMPVQGARHCPCAHVSAAAQVVPHAPQFIRSVCVSTHEVPQ
jgi:hypothetical protein